MKIVGQLVCGPGEADKYLKYTLDSFKRLCDDVIVATCNTGQKELDMLDSYDFRHYEDNREWGKYQPYIKTELLKKIIKLGADWILVLDADEELDITRQELEVLAKNRESCYFYIVNMWGDEQHYMRSLSFWNVRFYKVDPSKGVQFLKRPLHCGNAPPYFYARSAKSSHVPHFIKHRGLLTKSDRQKKSRRYDLYDPQAQYKGREYYDALLSEGSGTEYNKETIINKLKDYHGRLN